MQKINRKNSSQMGQKGLGAEKKFIVYKNLKSQHDCSSVIMGSLGLYEDVTRGRGQIYRWGGTHTAPTDNQLSTILENIQA